jgi:hypothetical protein
MTKKTTTVPATVSPLSLAIAADIKANLGANKSATEVSGAFDSQFPFPWALFKGNASAAKCGMSAAEFKLVRDTRTEYRDGWVAAGLKTSTVAGNMSHRLSVHAPTVEDKPTAAKTTEAKLEEALRAAYRHAVTLECEYTQQKMTDLLDFHGIELQDAES